MVDVVIFSKWASADELLIFFDRKCPKTLWGNTCGKRELCAFYQLQLTDKEIFSFLFSRMYFPIRFSGIFDRKKLAARQRLPI